MSLNLNWYKSYDTKRKNSKNANLCFWTKLRKNRNRNIFVLCHNFWTNQNLLKFSPVKHVIMTIWTSVLWKMIIHISKKWPELVVTLSFIKGHSFRISFYISRQQENLVDNQKCQAGFRPLCNKIPFVLVFPWISASLLYFREELG